MTIASEFAFPTTGIGSLPLHNIDAALGFSFRMDIPFLPQIPVRNPWEFMIAHALEGLPGLEVSRDGSGALNISVWSGRTKALQERLDEAFGSMSRPDAFEAFEPSPATSSSWQPFLWELQNREKKLAKVQIAGPLTSQWALRTREGTPAEEHPGVATQIYRLVLARALGMARRLQSDGVQPILYLDEPALYGINLGNPRHLLGLQELRIVVQTLRKGGVQVGVHCCSDTDWGSLFSLGCDIVSVDTRLSLKKILSLHRGPLSEFLQAGGHLSLGLVPTSENEGTLRSIRGSELAASLHQTLLNAFDNDPQKARTILKNALLTPACGLALLGASSAELVLDLLHEAQEELRTRFQ